MICLHLVIHASLFSIDDLELRLEDFNQKGFEFHVHLVVYNIVGMSSCAYFSEFARHRIPKQVRNCKFTPSITLDTKHVSSYRQNARRPRPLRNFRLLACVWYKHLFSVKRGKWTRSHCRSCRAIGVCL